MQTEEYTKLAVVEDQMWYFRSLHRHIVRELERCAVPAAGHVLDAGCGTGGLLTRLRESRPAGRFTGIDFSALACDLARRRLGGSVEIREASITALPFPGDTFDAVTCADVISQIERPAEAFAEFSRVLRPGGALVLDTAAYRWMWSYHDDSCETKHRFERREIAAFLGAAGFETRQLTHWNALPFPVVFAKRKLFSSARDTSDVKLYPAPIEAVFNTLMAAEHAWLRRGHRWAWGTSILAAAVKPLAR